MVHDQFVFLFSNSCEDALNCGRPYVLHSSSLNCNSLMFFLTAQYVCASWNAYNIAFLISIHFYKPFAIAHTEKPTVEIFENELRLTKEHTKHIW